MTRIMHICDFAAPYPGAFIRQIRMLEDHAGLPLFEQLGKKTYLTQAGTELLDFARAIIRQFEDAEAAMAHYKGIAGGRLLRHQLNYVKYFTEAYAWMIQPAFYGVDMTAELHEWERALQTQSPAIQNDVRASLHARRLRMPTPFKIARQRAARR